MHLGLKRNFQVMPGAQWLALLCKNIPDRYEHLVGYVGGNVRCEAPRRRGSDGGARAGTPDRAPLGAPSTDPASLQRCIGTGRRRRAH